jgi:outer membrane protein OmpA-like peptidoglycan-associated protein
MPFSLNKIIFILCILTISVFGQNDNLAITRYEKIPAATAINQIKVDSQNITYLASTKGVISINGDVVTPYITDKIIIDLAVNPIVGNWAIDKDGIYNVNTGKEIVLNQKGAVLTSIDIYKGKIFVGSDKGLYIINMPSQRVEFKNERNSELKSSHINFVYADSKGRCWIGTKKGEIRIENEKWQSDHDNQSVTHYYENKEGMWFISTNEKKKQEMWLIDHYNRYYDAGFGKDLYQGEFNDFAIDSKGKLYFASDAFIRFNPYEDKTDNYTENAGIISAKCSATVCDKNDVIWIGTAGDGLFKLTFKPEMDKNLSIACITEKKPSCYGKSDAVLRVIISGGQASFTYDWSEATLSGNNPKNVLAGNYTVTVTDKAGSKQICSIEIPSPELLYLDIAEINPIKSFNGKEGKVTVKAVGGAGEYKYQWVNGSSKNYLDNLAAGSYGVTVTDKNKCTAIGEYQLSREKILPDLAVKNLEVGKTLRIDELYFKADSSEISPQSYDVLNEVLTFLEQNPTIVVEIGGHTNSIPSHEYCDKLSSERAKSIATYFYQKGIKVERLSYKGYGKRKPITDSVSIEGRKKNQRVEIKIISI